MRSFWDSSCMSFDQAEQNQFYDPEVLAFFWVKKDWQSTYIVAGQGLVWLWLRGMVWLWLWGGVWGGEIYSSLCQLIYSSQISTSSPVCLQVSWGPGSWRIWWGQENKWENITTHTRHNITCSFVSCRLWTATIMPRQGAVDVDFCWYTSWTAGAQLAWAWEWPRWWGPVRLHIFSFARLKQNHPENAPYPRSLCCFQAVPEWDEYDEEARRHVWWCMETLPSCFRRWHRGFKRNWRNWSVPTTWPRPFSHMYLTLISVLSWYVFMLYTCLYVYVYIYIYI